MRANQRICVLLIAALLPAVPAAAQVVTYRVEGEVSSITYGYNPMLTHAIPFVLLHPHPDVVESLGLQGFDLPKIPECVPIPDTPYCDLVVPDPSVPDRSVPVDFTVTVDLSNPVGDGQFADVFVAELASEVTVGDNEFFFDELSVVLTNRSASSAAVGGVSLFPGILEPLPPLGLGFPPPGEPSVPIEFVPDSGLLHVPDNSGDPGFDWSREYSSVIYLTGEVVDHAIGFRTLSVTIVPEPAAVGMVFAMGLFAASRRRRAY